MDNQKRWKTFVPGGFGAGVGAAIVMTLVMGVAFLLLVSLIISTVLSAMHERFMPGQGWILKLVHTVVALAVITGDLRGENLVDRLLPVTNRNVSVIMIEIAADAAASTARHGGVVVVRGSDAPGVIGAWNALVGAGGLE